jgi:glutathione S-transferase
MKLIVIAFLLCAWGRAPPKRASEPFRLTYFPSKGRAEKIRLLFRVSNRTADLVETAVDSAKWPELKPKTPFGQLPVLRHGNEKIAQSNAILAYVAGKLGLSSYGDASQAKLISIVSAVDDLHHAMRPHKSTRNYEFVKEELKKYAGFFEKWLSAGNDDDEKSHFVDGKLTYSDVAVYDIFEQNLVDFVKVDEQLLIGLLLLILKQVGDAEEIIRTEFAAPLLAKLYSNIQKLAKGQEE